MTICEKCQQRFKFPKESEDKKYTCILCKETFIQLKSISAKLCPKCGIEYKQLCKWCGKRIKDK